MALSRWVIFVALCLGLLRAAGAHEVRPAYLQITERSDGHYDILWKQPSLGSKAVHLEPRISGLSLANTVIEAGGDSQIRRWRDVDAGAEGLHGRELRIEGLERTITDVLVRVEQADGTSRQFVLRPGEPRATLTMSGQGVAVLACLRLGVEHILGGIDHLAFVLGLMLLVRSHLALIQSITAFTLAHSITLAATALNLITPQPAVIETLVALSILFLATEVVAQYRGMGGLTSRYPWLIAFAVGLLHGAALAGALAEVGLPRDAIPAALMLFNLGVEIGQLLFIAFGLAAGLLLARYAGRISAGARWVAPYAMGSCATVWFLDRLGSALRLVPLAWIVFVVPAGPAQAAERQAYFGDLHLHTSYSFDAYINSATVVTPDEAYRFAKGETITYLGEPLQRREPLDFLAVTDHAENIGVFERLDHAPNAVSSSKVGRMFEAVRAALTRGARPDPEAWDALYQYFLGTRNELPKNLKAESTAAWQRAIDAANRNYQPGRFTTFIAYEWTSMANGANLHRNVIFKGDSAPYPFTSFDSRYPEDLWSWLESLRRQGIEALAIPHNANSSNGLMYDWVSSSGLPSTRVYAERRQANEPLSEIAQTKGASETHPLLSPNDEFADFEIYDYLAGLRSRESPLPGSYLRDGLGRGLLIQQRTGANPYKYGFAGASDQHSGLSVSNQADFAGSHYTINSGAGKPTREQAAQVLRDRDTALKETAGSLTGVWAESNTRESIYAALRRRETFATSGSRMRVRFFGGWGEHIQHDGVPMGSDLPVRPASTSAPTFSVWAAKDPNGANLERAQIIKVWVEGGRQHEKIVEVIAPGSRTQLSATWTDPAFNPQNAATYYLRVLEVPTPRWSALLATQHELPPPEGVPALTRQRAWSSPIWYTP